MLTKPKLLFGCYAVCVILSFGISGFEIEISAHHGGNLSPVVGWIIGLIRFPGICLAFCTVGVHSDHFILAVTLANIAFYMIVPFLFWKIFVRLRKQRNSEAPKNSGVPPKR